MCVINSICISHPFITKSIRKIILLIDQKRLFPITKYKSKAKREFDKYVIIIPH
jgi:hypothetical protein